MANMWKYITRNVRETFERRICSSLTDSSSQDKTPVCKFRGKFLPTIHTFCDKANVRKEYKFPAAGDKRDKKGQERSWNNAHIPHSWLGALGWSTAIVISWNLLQPLCRLQFSHNRERKCPFSKNHSSAHWKGTRVSHWKCDGHIHSKFSRWPFACQRIKSHNDETDGVWDSGHHSLENKERKSVNETNDVWDSGHHSLEQKRHSILQVHSVPLRVQSDTNYPSFWKVLTQTVWAKPTHVVPKPAKFEVHQKTVPENVENLKYGPLTAEQALDDAAKKFTEAQNFVMGDIDNKLGVELMQKGRHHEAVSFFSKAIGFSNASAAYNLGVCYEMGLGTNQDFKEAAKYYQLASDKGHATAMYNLGVFFVHGWGGLTCDCDQAHKLFEKASSLGQSDAKKALDLVKVEEVPQKSGREKSENTYDLVQQAFGLVQDLGLGYSEGAQSEKMNMNSNSDHKDISDLVHDSILKYTAMLQK